MAWYDKNAAKEWKTVIESPYSTESLLVHKDILIKQLTAEKQIQNFIFQHRFTIIEDSLRYCLEHLPANASNDRIYVYPAKAIELMTNDNINLFLGWESELVNKYFSLLIQHFITENSQGENSSSYHVYFEKLLKVLLKNIKVIKKQVIIAIQQEQKKTKFIQLMLKSSHRLQIVNYLNQFLIFDYSDNQILLNSDVKSLIINNSLSYLQKFTKFQAIEEQRVQNLLFMIKVYFQQSIKFLSIKPLIQAQLYEKKKSDFQKVYSFIQQKFNIFPTILKSNSANCLKLIVLQILQLIQILKLKIGISLISPDIKKMLKQDVIIHILNQPISIIHPLFIQWLIFIFSDVGQNSDDTDLICKAKIIPQILNLITVHKTNSILIFRLFEFLKIIFINIEKEVILNIEKYKNINIQLISFKLFTEFFDHFHKFQEIVKSFKSYNQHLFTSIAKLVKIFFIYSNNILNVFNHYSVIQICSKKKENIEHLIDFYQKQACFKLYQTQISKDLGCFFKDQVFQNIVPLEYTVINKTKLSTNIASNTLGVTAQSMQSKLATKFPQKQVTNIIPLPESTLIQIKFDQNILKDVSVQPQQPKLANSQSCIQINDKNDQEKVQQIGKSYQDFRQKKLKQAEMILKEKRTKSKTPTKMKSDSKKSRSKWGQTQSDSKLNQNCQIQQQNISNNITTEKQIKRSNRMSPRISKAFIQLNLAKVSLIKINASKKFFGKKQRLLDIQRDSRLCKWLNLLKEIR